MEHEQEYKTENIDVEYCEQVEEMMPDTEMIRFKRLPEIEEAVCLKCYVPYNHLNENFAEILRYIDDHGYHISAQHRTQYVDGPWNQKDPEKWLTIIQVPVVRSTSSRPLPHSKKKGGDR